jgi:hypothetical protein
MNLSGVKYYYLCPVLVGPNKVYGTVITFCTIYRIHFTINVML